MSRLSRTSLLAIAATAAVAISAFTPTNASAFGHFGGGRFHSFHGYHFGYHGFHHPYRFGHWGWGRFHYRFGHYGWGRYQWGFGNRYRWWYPRFSYWRYNNFPRPFVYGGLAAGTMAAVGAPAQAMPAPQQAPQQANCLIKTYLPNGAVAFADQCTQEQAVSMPNAMQPPGQPGQ